MMSFENMWAMYWFPSLLVLLLVIAVSITVTWLIIFTAVRAALRSVRADEVSMRTGRYGLPPSS